MSTIQKRRRGLLVDDLVTGAGRPVARGDRVLLRVRGTVNGGSLFDAGEVDVRYLRGELLNAVFYGLEGMRFGGRRRVLASPGYTGDLRRIEFAGNRTIPAGASVVLTLEIEEPREPADR